MEVMFGGKHRAGKVENRPKEPVNGSVETPPDVALLDGEGTTNGSLTLSTLCTCGHPRKDHRGLRMDVRGACLTCECDEFDMVSDTLERLRAALAQAERLQETAALLRARMLREQSSAAVPPSNGHIHDAWNGHP